MYDVVRYQKSGTTVMDVEESLRWAAARLRAEAIRTSGRGRALYDEFQVRCLMQVADAIAAGPTPPAAASVACDCRAAVEGLLHTIRKEDRRPSENYCAALEDVIAMLTTGAAPFTCPHCGFVYYDERQRIICNNCGERPEDAPTTATGPTPPTTEEGGSRWKP